MTNKENQLHFEVTEAIKSPLTNAMYNVEEAIAIIEDIKRRIYIEVVSGEMTRSFKLKIDGSVIPRKGGFDKLQENFVDDFLEEKYRYKSLKALKDNIELNKAIIRKAQICEVDIFAGKINTCDE